MRSPGYEPKDYDVSILITDGSGQPLADQKLSYRVDGGTRQNGITDKNGMLTITLSDGAHGIRLADTQAEIYIDNYSGFGICVDQYREQPVLTFLADGSCDPVPDGSEEPGGTEGSGGTEEPGGTVGPGGSQERPDGSQGQGGPAGDSQYDGNPEKNPEKDPEQNPEQNPQDTRSENKDETTAPQTGDDVPAASAALLIFMICGAALSGAAVVRRRKL